MIFGFIPTIACIIYNRPLPKHNAHLTDADWVVVVVTSLSTLTPTYLFVLVRGEYRRPFTYGLLEQASVRPHSLSGHEADSLTCDHLSNCPSYCQNNPYNDETFDESFHTGDYLFIQVERCNLGVTSRKAPAFLQGLLQFELRLVGGGGLEPPTPCL